MPLCVGCAVGVAVAPDVGTAVAPEVGDDVAPDVGDDVAPDVGDDVAPDVGDDVAPDVGTALGALAAVDGAGDGLGVGVRTTGIVFTVSSHAASSTTATSA